MIAQLMSSTAFSLAVNEARNPSSMFLVYGWWSSGKTAKERRAPVNEINGP